jgi:hypothetical protein
VAWRRAAVIVHARQARLVGVAVRHRRIVGHFDWVGLVSIAASVPVTAAALDKFYIFNFEFLIVPVSALASTATTCERLNSGHA